jgi:hypothetical protein
MMETSLGEIWRGARDMQKSKAREKFSGAYGSHKHKAVCGG